MARPVGDRRTARAVSLPHDPTSVREARRLLAADLEPWDGSGGAVHDAQVVLSELLANAVRHAPPIPGDGLEAAWTLCEETVELRVTDGSGIRAPRAHAAGTEDVSGRGLTIVDALAADWGVDDAADRRTVWARIALDGSPPSGLLGP